MGFAKFGKGPFKLFGRRTKNPNNGNKTKLRKLGPGPNLMPKGN